MALQAKLYDLTHLYPPGYDGYICDDEEKNYHSIVRAHIIENKYNDGDIIFLGSTYETRQEYGFYYVTKSSTDFAHGEYVYDCISYHDHKIYYNDLLVHLKTFLIEYFDDELGAQSLDDPEYIKELKEAGKLI